MKQVQKSNKETNQIQKLCLEVLYHTLKAHGESALIDAQDQGATKISIALLKNPDERVRELGKSKSDAGANVVVIYHCVTILVVIIVKIIFITSFLFCCLLLHHSLQTQTVLLTALNIFSLVYSNYLYIYSNYTFLHFSL